MTSKLIWAILYSLFLPLFFFPNLGNANFLESKLKENYNIFSNFNKMRQFYLLNEFNFFHSPKDNISTIE